MNAGAQDGTSTYSTNQIIKFAEDTTVMGLMQNNDASAHRDKVQTLTVLCIANNLAPNTSKTEGGGGERNPLLYTTM